MVAPHGGRLGRVELEGEAEDPVDAVHPVDLVPVGDVEVRGLHRAVAVPRRHRAAERREGVAVQARHVRGHIGLRVAVGPEDELAVGVQRDVGADLLDAVNHAAVHEVPNRPNLRGGPGAGPAIRDVQPAAGAAVAAAPPVAVVAVEIREDRHAGRRPLEVLAPGAERGAGEVIAHAVRVDGKDDEGLALVHEARGLLVRAVAVRQPAQDRQRLLRGQVLAGVVEGVDEDLRLVLVHGHVVADLGHQDHAALVAPADGEDAHDVRVVHGGLADLANQLRPVVVPAPAGRPVRLGGQCGRRGDVRHEGERQCGERGTGAMWAREVGDRTHPCQGARPVPVRAMRRSAHTGAFYSAGFVRKLRS